MNTSYYTSITDEIPIKCNSSLFNIKYIVVDVDGTLTDGGIYYDEKGNELKKFNTKDAGAFFTAKVSGIKVLILTGRECAATQRRMSELQAFLIKQNVVDKVDFLKKYMAENNIQKSELAYIGDDLNDYNGMKLAGFRACPKDAVEEIKFISDYISKYDGGMGAVRDIVEYMLKKRGQWEAAYKQCYKIDE